MPADKSLSHYGTIHHELFDPALAEARRVVVSMVADGSSVLDLGCGTGQLCFALKAEKECRVVGVDLSLRMLRFAEKVNRHPDITFLHKDATDLFGIEDQSFDYATVLLLGHELPRDMRLRVLGEALRVAKRVPIVDAKAPLPWNPGGLAIRTKAQARSSSKEPEHRTTDPEEVPMTDRTAPTSPMAYARVAGLGYLIIIVTGIFAEFFVRSSLIVPGDAAATANNIAASELLFRTGIASELIMLLCDVLVAVALYVLFKGVDKSLALLAAFFRLAHASIVGVNLLNTYVPLLLLGDAAYLTAFDLEQLHALVLLFLQAHSFGYVIGLVFFGVHCLILGYLVFRSGYVPRILGVLLIVASLGYLMDSFSRALLVNYAEYETVFLLIVFVPAFMAEVSFCLWLLVKGVDVRGAEEPRTEDPR
jgi:SAM-dependent methyltransferase